MSDIPAAIAQLRNEHDLASYAYAEPLYSAIPEIVDLMDAVNVALNHPQMDACRGSLRTCLDRLADRVLQP